MTLLKVPLWSAIVATIFASVPAYSDMHATTRIGPNVPDASAVLIEATLEGTIKPRDLNILETAISREAAATSKPIVIAMFLNSTGGDVATALEIGRALRAHKGMALVEYDSVCGSACVFVLAAGASRVVKGDVLIHRPYVSDDQSETALAQKQKYSKFRSLVAPYLEQMNVAVSLYDDMLRISPSESKKLSIDDLARYGLSANDPYEDEAVDVSNAKKLGITREEYARRQAEADAKCPTDNLPDNFNDPRWEAYAACHSRIMGFHD